MNEFFRNAVFFWSQHSFAGLFVHPRSAQLRSARGRSAEILAPENVAFNSDANVPGVAIALTSGNSRQSAYTIRGRSIR